MRDIRKKRTLIFVAVAVIQIRASKVKTKQNKTSLLLEECCAEGKGMSLEVRALCSNPSSVHVCICVCVPVHACMCLHV